MSLYCVVGMHFLSWLTFPHLHTHEYARYYQINSHFKTIQVAEIPPQKNRPTVSPEVFGHLPVTPISDYLTSHSKATVINLLLHNSHLT